MLCEPSLSGKKKNEKQTIKWNWPSQVQLETSSMYYIVLIQTLEQGDKYEKGVIQRDGLLIIH